MSRPTRSSHRHGASDARGANDARGGRDLRRPSMAVASIVAMLAALVPLAPATADEPGATASADLEPGDRGQVDGAVPGQRVPALEELTEPVLPPPAAETDPVTDQDSFELADSHATDTTDTTDGTGEEPTGPVAFDVRPSVLTTGTITPPMRIYGRGWGHGVGMSQFGAYAQALEGRSASQILTHYYPGTQVTTDTRATDNRIRAGIRTEQPSSPIRALDGTVAWRVCSPSTEPAANGRVPASRCADWFTQPADELLRVLPLPAAGVVTAQGTQSSLDGALVTVDIDGAVIGDANGPDASSDPPLDPATDGTTTPVPAPRGGILIQRQTPQGWAAYRAYRTPVDGTIVSGQLPVARADHGSGRIRGQGYGAAEYVYAHGWRDYHLMGTPDEPDTHQLTVVQDVSSVERYLRGLAEVPSSWPEATLESQAIAGRTYALRGSRGGSCRCDKVSTSADQVFIGESKVEAVGGHRWAAAVAATEQQVLTYEGALAQTFYSSSHGGRTENVEDSWAYGTTAVGYLRSQDDPWSLMDSVGAIEIPNSRRTWAAAASNRVMSSFLSAGQPTAIVRVERIQVLSRTDGGTPRQLRVTGATATGERITFDTGLEAQYAKGIAGGAMRRALALVEGGEVNGRISSSQITRFGFAPFVDDDATTHEYAITWAATAGVVRGIEVDRFAPGRDVTRGQMATFLNNTFALPSAPAGADTFPDVTPGSTHHAAIEAIAAAEITLGYGDGTYRPLQPVSRKEMATFLTRAMALSASTTERVFDDVDPTSTHGAAIAAVAEADITAGCVEQRFCPNDTVTRGQLASFVYRSVTR